MLFRKNISFGILFTIIALLLSSCNDGFENSPYPNPKFTQIASIPDGARSSAVAFSINGKGYVALGKRNVRTNFLKDCWEYDPLTNLWTPKDSFPGAARVKAIAQVVDSIAYVGLGFGNEDGVYLDAGYYNDFWAFNPRTNKWTRKADFPSTEVDGCVSFVYNKMIYVGFGFNGYGFPPEFWKYNPETDTWTQLNAFPGYSRMVATAVTDGNRIFCGTGYKAMNMNDWWEYFPLSDTWHRKKDVPDNGRLNAISWALNGRIFMGTGRHFAGEFTGGGVKNDVLEYDIDKNCWYATANFPGSGRENAISFTINGKTYVGLGENDSQLLSDIWCFEP